MKEKFWPLVFTREDNEVTEGEVFFLLVQSMAHFFTKSHKIHLTGSTGEGSTCKQREAPKLGRGKGMLGSGSRE